MFFFSKKMKERNTERKKNLKVGFAEDTNVGDSFEKNKKKKLLWPNWRANTLSQRTSIPRTMDGKLSRKTIICWGSSFLIDHSG